MFQNCILSSATPSSQIRASPYIGTYNLKQLKCINFSLQKNVIVVRSEMKNFGVVEKLKEATQYCDQYCDQHCDQYCDRYCDQY